jgi:hypothetical protein
MVNSVIAAVEEEEEEEARKEQTANRVREGAAARHC